MSSLFRNKSWLVMLTLSAILMLTACGGTNTADTPASGTEPSNSAAANGDTRTIQHAMGEETLTGTPERVVILTNEGTEALLAVGVKPVGAVQSWVGDPWYDHIKDQMEGVEVLGEETQPNVELIAGLKPDLIIGNKVRHEKIYDQLKQIAPTVFAEELSGNWKNNMLLYTEAVNKKAEGEQAIAEFDQRVEDVKSKLGDKADTKVSVVRFTAADVRTYMKDTFSGVLLEQLGIARPADQDKNEFIEKLTKERIPAMDGDVLFYFTQEDPGSTDAQKASEEWMDEPLFKSLNVAKNNEIHKVNEVVWNLAGGYEAANLLLDEIAAYFEVN
ncbi:ABC transporter substrate-binding protein [Paenibacillus lemnae]|uniref:Iron-siderophore ABC transporter substrate-binding protein n=1 Tax=Paenibacillus lemnae TaxID=1330551 RepID=A0A848MAK1_PAELE|nr:iron-siderophore ABC transporter substrate-binding protein [Paenibacillus lemnae]NMO97190.1 iron-siderophore ABC transporter substrate-binding protein [Paenibacillus lemnae]